MKQNVCNPDSCRACAFSVSESLFGEFPFGMPASPPRVIRFSNEQNGFFFSSFLLFVVAWIVRCFVFAWTSCCWAAMCDRRTEYGETIAREMWKGFSFGGVCVCVCCAFRHCVDALSTKWDLSAPRALLCRLLKGIEYECVCVCYLWLHLVASDRTNLINSLKSKKIEEMAHNGCVSGARIWNNVSFQWMAWFPFEHIHKRRATWNRSLNRWNTRHTTTCDGHETETKMHSKWILFLTDRLCRTRFDACVPV